MPMMITQAAYHVREHQSVLMEAEKRFLVRVARWLPERLNSDHLTLLGMFGMFLAGLSFWAARWDDRTLYIVPLALAINWFGDSMDGTLARVRDRQRPRYGFYVDHVVDVVGALFLLGGLALSGYSTPMLALALLAGFLMVSAEAYLAAHALGVFRLSFMKIGPTELRILLIAGTLKLLNDPFVDLGALGSHLLFDVGAVCGLAGMAVTFVVSAVRNTMFLYDAEPLVRKPR